MDDKADEPRMTHPPLPSINEIGSRIRQVRTIRKMSLAELSQHSGVSIAMLSNVERGQAYPSVQTLQKIVAILDIDISELFRSGTQGGQIDSEVIVRSADRLRVKFGSDGLAKQLLSPARSSDLEMLMLEIEPGCTSGPVPWVRNSEKAGLVIEGRFEFTLGSATSLLEEGDSFQFDGRTPHSFRNPGQTMARVLWIIRSDTIA